MSSSAPSSLPSAFATAGDSEFIEDALAWPCPLRGPPAQAQDAASARRQRGAPGLHRQEVGAELPPRASKIRIWIPRSLHLLTRGGPLDKGPICVRLRGNKQDVKPDGGGWEEKGGQAADSPGVGSPRGAGGREWPVGAGCVTGERPRRATRGGERLARESRERDTVAGGDAFKCPCFNGIPLSVLGE